ncbi:MAG: alpha/beta fold hydrolase [Dehalococcoidia bacterium]
MVLSAIMIPRLVGGLALLGTVHGAVSVLFAHRFTWQQGNPGLHVIDASPADEGLPFEDITFPADTDGLTISGWLISHDDSGTAVVMVPSGGHNRLNRPIDPGRTARAQLTLARSLWARGHTVLLYDPRGTGRSEGSRLSYGFLEARDLVGALRFLEGRGYAPARVGVLGWSMGAATAMFALTRVRYGGLVADSALASFSNEDIARYAASGLGLPLALARAVTPVMTFGVFAAARLLWGIDLRARAIDALREHPVPILVIHGAEDSQVPVAIAPRLAEAAGDAFISAHFLDGVDHVRAYASDPAWYVRTVGGALEMMLSTSPRAALSPGLDP